MLNAIAIVILAAMMLIPLVNIFVGVVVGSRLGGVLGPWLDRCSPSP